MLNDDVLILIFQRCDYASLLVVECVSTKWKELGSACWKGLSRRDWPGKRTDNFHQSPLLKNEMLVTHRFHQPTLSSPFLWKRYYYSRLEKQQENFIYALNSILFNFHVTVFPHHEDLRNQIVSYTRKSLIAAMRPMLDAEFPTFCLVRQDLFACPDHVDQFRHAARFLIFNLHNQLEIDNNIAIPAVLNIQETNHPLIVHVTIGSGTGKHTLPRNTYLCFTETMGLIDGAKASVIDSAYQWFLESDAYANALPSVNSLNYDQFRKRLVSKIQTLLANYPHGIASHLFENYDTIEYCIRYILCNAKCSNITAPVEDRIAWMPFSENVDNVMLPPVYNSNEVFQVQCTFSYSRFTVLAETGQVIRQNREQLYDPWKYILRFGRQPLDSNSNWIAVSRSSMANRPDGLPTQFRRNPDIFLA